MTTVHACTGHSAMNAERRIRTAAGVLAWVLAAAAVAAEPPPPPAPAQAAHQVVAGGDLWSRLLPDEASPVRRLDPAIFTELSPVTASDPAVRLPDDQREADGQHSSESR